MFNTNNQTDPEWLTNINPLDKGVGVFAIADVESSEFGAAKIIKVPEITYPDCVKRGIFTLGFKWIPDTLSDQIRNHECAEEFGIDTQPTPGECLIVMGQCVKA
ncbi:hypothetical protein [Gimesia sp.]|uniref:hypothetical protein n=1 Tax=Gimesia sp. TaxID=2024833 RepID=UPI0032EE313F